MSFLTGVVMTYVWYRYGQLIGETYDQCSSPNIVNMTYVWYRCGQLIGET